MLEEETDPWRIILLAFLVFLGVSVVLGDSLDTDRVVLLDLKSFLEESNQVNRGYYSEWNHSSSNPCDWTGIKCSSDSNRVIGVNLSENGISKTLFSNFSALTELSHLDLSKNTLSGQIPADLSRCNSLVYLNLSHNILDGVLNLTGLNSLQTLDLSKNRISGGVQTSFPAICNSLVVLNISENNLTGSIEDVFDLCYKLRYLDLSMNDFSGNIWKWFGRLQEFLISDNHLSGSIPASSFTDNCSLEVLDLSGNNFSGQFPGNISNCRDLVILHLWGNNFTGQIPPEIGWITGLEALFLGNNSFSRDIPESLLNLKRLAFLDLSRINFGGEIQETLGKFTQVKYLVLHTNSYTGGLYSSGILNLTNIVRLDLSYNNLSGPLPVEVSRMPSLKFLILAFNQFNGSIPLEYGDFPLLQALDLSFNELTGTIPSSLGKLSSLMWLMLANNQLVGEIPPEIGNCSSLLWLNLADNKLSGHMPPELSNIGQNPKAAFESNQQTDRIIPGSGECLSMKRWIPADYPPFSFVYAILSRRTCRNLWNQLLKGVGLFAICTPGTLVRTYQISGYVQLSGNRLSGEIPSDIGKMRNFSMLHIGDNNFSGKLPQEIGELPLMVLNISINRFSGEVPSEIGEILCLQNLDLSYNNFSGTFPVSLNNLTGLSEFNVSYNPMISGVIPATGQLSTFEKESFLGDPLLVLLSFPNQSHYPWANNTTSRPRLKKPPRFSVFLVLFALVLAFLVFGIFLFVLFSSVKSPLDFPEYLLEEIKYRREFGSSSSSSSPWLSESVPVIQLVKRAFTYGDILKATSNFSDEKVIGKGGFGTVYRGVLPDGREVAVKKLQREGIEGEKEFQAEMEVLCGDRFDWPHPNLVPLYGWCLYRSEKILVYQYMEGGSLEDLIPDRVHLTWQRRMNVAVDVARALVFLHHECYPPIVHRDVKASNVLLNKSGRAHVTDFGLARIVDAGDSHVSTVVAGTIGYVAPEYGQTWKATPKGDVYSFGVLIMELATGRRAVDGGEECLVEWAKRVMGSGRQSARSIIPVALMGSGLAEGADEMCELLRVGMRCTAESPQARPNMKEVLGMLFRASSRQANRSHSSSPPSSL
ncbi:probable LRR receptor-like serine/threonine-protein kinase At1g74360 [Rhodamnia argentea]|uniref:non-specific serine/threonine protein kinase n=1 Tax=Rhodamnia argentea TaxID=178133 RepID=A0A8B8PCJ5_9MYRT|nr:probable LRR receptor-like serine/threonine-protein kinase At1g74360 [Rhodamnia argentea]